MRHKLRPTLKPVFTRNHTLHIRQRDGGIESIRVRMMRLEARERSRIAGFARLEQTLGLFAMVLEVGT